MNPEARPTSATSRNTGEKHPLVDRATDFVNSLVERPALPTKEALGYESTVTTYGGVLANIDGKMVFDMTGIMDRLDQIGDPILRTFDEHMVKDPIGLLKKHPTLFFKFMFNGPKRYRGNPTEIAENAARLGLGDIYKLHARGIEITERELYTEGRYLIDIFRADQIENCDMVDVDRFYATGYAAQYMRHLHDKLEREGHAIKGIGEPTTRLFVFRDIVGGLPSDPSLYVPDIVYNPKKLETTGGGDMRGTDMLDFLMGIGVEELRRSDGDMDSVQRLLVTALDSYDSSEMNGIIKSFAMRGRLTLSGDERLLDLSAAHKLVRPLAAGHNMARLRYDKAVSAQLRQLVVRACNEMGAAEVPGEEEFLRS